MEQSSPARKAEEGSDTSPGSSNDGRVANDGAPANNGGKSGGLLYRHRQGLSYDDSEKGMFEFFGWVYHLGVNKIGREYCHLRFLFIRGKHVLMYKRDPHENPGIKPIRKVVIGPTLMVEELGRRRVNSGDLYVIQFYNRLDESKKGEIACATAGEARKWMEAFNHAKQQAEYDLLSRSGGRNKFNMEADIDLEGHRPKVRRYAQGLRKLIRIGHGPEKLLRQSSRLNGSIRSDSTFEGDLGDAVEAYEWKCVRTINGVRIFEDVADSKSRKYPLVKAVAVIDATADTVFDVILDLDRRRRYEWDVLTGDLELVDSYDGHYDVVYGTYEPKYLSRWQSKRDFVFTRQWFRVQDGAYTILQFPAVHKKRPQKAGYRRIEFFPSTWEIRSLDGAMGTNNAKCLVTQMLEIHSNGWWRWKKNGNSKFEKSIPFALLSQVAGLKEYIGANPFLKCEASAMIIQSKLSKFSVSSGEFEDEVKDEFYDAIGADSSSSSEDEETEVEDDKKGSKVRLKNVSWAISSLALKRTSAADRDKELDSSVPPVDVDLNHFSGSLHKAKNDIDGNCWSSANGSGFMIRGQTYLKDGRKITGGDPLLKLIAVDWFKVEKAIDKIASHPKCLVQSEAAKKLPFILVINLQVPAKPNYSLVLYYAADRPVNKTSLLGKFVDGTDVFRDSRFKLIPSIVDGYWMVKRAVGSKACLLGKAVTCKYFREENYLEIDVDIGSSSVARSVIGLVLGYVTSLVVDLAILIEAKEKEELPEYILGTVRLNHVRPDSAVPLES